MNNVKEKEMIKNIFTKIDFLCKITNTTLYDVEYYAELEKESLSKEKRFLTQLSLYSVSNIAKLFEVSIDDLLNESIYEFSRKVQIAILKKEINKMEDELDKEWKEKKKLYKEETGKNYVSDFTT